MTVFAFWIEYLLYRIRSLFSSILVLYFVLYLVLYFGPVALITTTIQITTTPTTQTHPQRLTRPRHWLPRRLHCSLSFLFNLKLHASRRSALYPHPRPDWPSPHPSLLKANLHLLSSNLTPSSSPIFCIHAYIHFFTLFVF